MNDSDDIIIHRVLDGDRAAFDVLVDRYKNRLYALVLAKTGDTYAVEDIVQQTFMEAYSNLKSLEDYNKLSPWLSRIASNQCYRWRQKSYRHERYKDTYRSEILHRHPANNQTPESLYMDHEMRMRVLEAVEELKPEQREVVVLRYMEDMSYQEIASYLDMPMSTVVGRFRLAKNYLHSALTPIVSDVLKGLRPPASFMQRFLSVTTMAGSGKIGHLDGPAKTASFTHPVGMTRDHQGNIYIVEAFGNRVRKIDRFGNVTTIAGSGKQGFVDGPGPRSQFNRPVGIAVDQSGNLYIGDHFNHCIRKITQDGYVTTFAGTGIRGMADGPGKTAQFAHPSNLIVDPNGYLIVLDTMNYRICRIDPTGYVTTIEGSGENVRGEPFAGPRGIVMDSNGSIFIADTFNHRIRQITPNGYVSTIAGSGHSGLLDGPGSIARFHRPYGLAIDSDENLYVTEPGHKQRPGNHAIRKIFKINGVHHVETFASTGKSGLRGEGDFADGPMHEARFNQPMDMIINHTGHLLVVDTGNFRIRKLQTTKNN